LAYLHKNFGGKTARPVTPRGNERAGGIKAHNDLQGMFAEFFRNFWGRKTERKIPENAGIM
jgi:hypothetical protein